jgi:5-methyltetrahydropteroyltriglutamate--homocysteine methyltransferase
LFARSNGEQIDMAAFEPVVKHAVAERIVRYAKVLGRENIIAGVDCGFSTVAGTEDFRVDPKIAWAKLAALTHGARIASDQLWG